MSPPSGPTFNLVFEYQPIASEILAQPSRYKKKKNRKQFQANETPLFLFVSSKTSYFIIYFFSFAKWWLQRKCLVSQSFAIPERGFTILDKCHKTRKLHHPPRIEYDNEILHLLWEFIQNKTKIEGRKVLIRKWFYSTKL